jgi:hypothetical protein
MNEPGAGPTVGELPDTGEELDPLASPTEGDGQPEGEPAELPSTESDEGGEPEGGEGQPTEGKEDGRVIPQHIRALKETNPAAYKAAKAEFFELRSWRDTFPKIQDARDAKELIESAGGADGISEMRQLTSEFREAANQFLEGSPKFIQDLAEDDPVAFSLHFPIMLQEMQKRDFGYFADNISKLWDTEFENTGIPRVLQDAKVNLEKLAKGPERDAALFYVNEVLKWQQSISGRSKKAEDPRVKSLLADRAKSRQTEAQSELKELNKDYQNKALNTVIPAGRKEFDSAFKGYKLDEKDRQRLFGQVVAAANATVERDKHFKADRDALLKDKDVNGALRLVRSRYAQEWANAVKEVARLFRIGAGPGKQPQQQQQNTNQNGNQRPVEKGWIKVNARPDGADIDRSRTPNEMIIGRRAILKDGRKVDWTHLK